jgi:succinate-acetate transporter protein
MSTPSEASAAPALAVTDPAPLGLAGFALTTFLLSAANAGMMTARLAIRGSASLSPTAVSPSCSPGCGSQEQERLRGQGLLDIRQLLDWPWPVGTASRAEGDLGAAAAHDLGWILLAFAIFNTYMMIWSTQINMAVFEVFLTLEITEIVLFIGNFAMKSSIVHIGGYIGVLTALVAWYASAAGVASGIGGRIKLPVGSPLLPARAAESVHTVAA